MGTDTFAERRHRHLSTQLEKCHADDQHERSDQKQGNGSGLHRHDKNAEQQHNDGDGKNGAYRFVEFLF